MIDFRAIRGWVFDIDDTLYLERTYVLSGFAAVDRWLVEVHDVRGFGKAAIARFNRGARGNTFDLALADIGYPNAHGLVAEMVQRYRTHEPAISLATDAARHLQRLSGKMPIAIVSDGPLASQERKVKALELASVATTILLTDRWGPEFHKPHARAFREIQTAWEFKGEQLVYAADNPSKDFHAPRALGWQTIRIARPEGEYSGLATPINEAILEIASFDDLEEA